jgi:hypothetical protein
VDAASIMPGMGDIADRLFGTDGAELMTDEQDGMVDE